MCYCTPTKRTPCCENCPDDMQITWGLKKHKAAYSGIPLSDIINFITDEVKKKIDQYFIEKFLSIELMLKEKIIAEACANNPMIMNTEGKANDRN